MSWTKMVLATLMVTALVWSAVAQPETGIEIGLALVDSVFADEHLRGITAGDFDERLNQLDMASVTEGVVLANMEGESVSVATTMMSPSAGDTMVMYLALPWGAVQGLTVTEFSAYSAVITVEAQFSDVDTPTEIRFPSAEHFVFDVPKTSGRRLYFRRVPADLGSCEWIRVHLDLAIKAGDGAVAETFDLVASFDQSLSALTGEEVRAPEPVEAPVEEAVGQEPAPESTPEPKEEEPVAETVPAEPAQEEEPVDQPAVNGAALEAPAPPETP